MEMLTVIAILGIMTSIAVLGYGGVHESAVNEKDKRNAQNIANMAAVASAAGASFAEANDKSASVENLREGRSPSSGAFRGRLFQLPSMNDHEVEGALRYLRLKGKELVYHQVPE